jgi:hypothetical protein
VNASSLGSLAAADRTERQPQIQRRR